MALSSDSSNVLISITRVSYLGEPRHWEGVITVQNRVVCQVNGPTYWGVLDRLTDSLKEEETIFNKEWLNWDANKK